MTKSEAYKHFTEGYSKLSDSQRKDFSKIALRLLDETFLVKAKDEDRADYLKSLDMVDALSGYFAFMDYALIQDSDKGILYIRTELDSNRVHLKKLETIVLLTLRGIYFDEASKASINATISTTVGHLASEIIKTEVYGDFQVNSNEFRSALRALRRYKIIDFDFGGGEFGEMPIIIYRSILIVVDLSTLEELQARLGEYRGGNADEEDSEA